MPFSFQLVTRPPRTRLPGIADDVFTSLEAPVGPLGPVSLVSIRSILSVEDTSSFEGYRYAEYALALACSKLVDVERAKLREYRQRYATRNVDILVIQTTMRNTRPFRELCRLLDLPPNVRTMIWAHVLTVRPPIPHHQPPVTRTCRLLRHETLPQYYAAHPVHLRIDTGVYPLNATSSAALETSSPLSAANTSAATPYLPSALPAPYTRRIEPGLTLSRSADYFLAHAAAFTVRCLRRVHLRLPREPALVLTLRISAEGGLDLERLERVSGWEGEELYAQPGLEAGSVPWKHGRQRRAAQGRYWPGMSRDRVSAEHRRDYDEWVRCMGLVSGVRDTVRFVNGLVGGEGWDMQERVLLGLRLVASLGASVDEEIRVARGERDGRTKGFCEWD